MCVVSCRARAGGCNLDDVVVGQGRTPPLLDPALCYVGGRAFTVEEELAQSG